MGRKRKEIEKKSKTHSYSCYDIDYIKIKKIINYVKKKGEKDKK